MHWLYEQLCLCIRVYLCAFVRACEIFFVRQCVRTCLPTYKYIYICVCVRVCMRVHVYRHCSTFIIYTCWSYTHNLTKYFDKCDRRQDLLFTGRFKVKFSKFVRLMWLFFGVNKFYRKKIRRFTLLLCQNIWVVLYCLFQEPNAKINTTGYGLVLVSQRVQLYLLKECIQAINSHDSLRVSLRALLVRVNLFYCYSYLYRLCASVFLHSETLFVRLFPRLVGT